MDIIPVESMWQQCNEHAAKYTNKKIGTAQYKILKIINPYNRYFTNYYDPNLRDVAALFINNHLFMSLIPFELESHINLIKWAHGRVFVGGCGMGWYLNQVLAKPEVTKVTVVEFNPDVIALYKQTFGVHPKLEIVHGDALAYTSAEEFDFAYIDIGAEMPKWEIAVPRELEDARTLAKNLKVKLVGFWGVERYLFQHYTKFAGRKELIASLGFPFGDEQFQDCVDLTAALIASEGK